MTRILIIEDDVKLTELLRSDFELEGFSVLTAGDGLAGLEAAQRDKPDLVILDVMLPRMSGYDVCRALRKEGSQIPILMLTARGQEAEKVIGLEMGADDYLSKPFGALELMARIKALLRRHHREIKNLAEVDIDTLHFDFQRYKATKGGKPLDLSHKEFQVLELLLRHRGEAVSRRQFLEEVWEYEDLPTTRTVDNQILSLRQKLAGKAGHYDDYIVTVHGIGYKFVR